MTFPALGYDQEADFEEGRPTDADALSPDWVHTVLDALSEADSETDADSDLNAVAGASKLGTNGFRVTFDDGNAAFFTVNATSVDQTEATVNIWINPTNVGIDNNEEISLLRFVDGTPSVVHRLKIRKISGNYNLRFQAELDNGSLTTVGDHVISSGSVYVHAQLVFRHSSGVGNDDGFAYIRVDDSGSISTYSATGLDDDTKDWDEIRVGMNLTNAASPSGSFDFDEVRISESVSPVWITGAAALAGSFGAAFTIEDTTARYVAFTGPTAETAITAEAEIDPNALTMATNDTFNVLQLRETGAVNNRTSLNFDGTDYRIQASILLDSGGSQTTSLHTITDAQHTVRVVWIASSGVGNDDGELHLYIDGELQESLTGIDNDTRAVDEVRGGAAEGIDSGTSGVFFMDDMRWADDVILPQSNAGSLSPSGALAAVYTQLISLAGSISPSGALTRAITWAQSVGGSISPSGALATVKQRIFRAVVRFVATITQDAHYDDTVEGAARYDNEIEQDAHLG